MKEIAELIVSEIAIRPHDIVFHVEDPEGYPADTLGDARSRLHQAGWEVSINNREVRSPHGFREDYELTTRFGGGSGALTLNVPTRSRGKPFKIDPNTKNIPRITGYLACVFYAPENDVRQVWCAVP